MRMLAVLTGITLALAGCGVSSSPGETPSAGTPSAMESAEASPSGQQLTGTITVLAAASLTETFTTIAEQVQDAHPGTTVKLSFGGSSTLAAQLVAGAPADVFAAASARTMATVVDAGLAEPPQVFARNALAIAVPPNNPGQITALADLAKPGVTVALCAPAVPCGAVARQTLERAGVSVTPVSEERDVRAVLTKVRLGEVDAGIVYRTDVSAAGADVKGIEVPAGIGVLTDYPVAVLRATANAALAQAFVEQVRSAAGAAVLREAGFILP